MLFMITFIVFVGMFTSVANYQLTHERNVIIITDVETDDQIGVAVACVRIPDRILFIGTTLMNSQRKAALVKHQLSYFKNLKHVEVFAGTGGTPGDYKEMNSTMAGLSYTHEGVDILDSSELRKFEKSKASSSTNTLQNEIQKTLMYALKKGITVDFILLAPPTDLMAVLEKNSEYATAINHIYVMGGWVIDNTGVLRTTYNVNMDVMASSQLMEFAYDHKVDTTLWSSHSIKDTFGGGSINAGNFPNLIRMIFDSTAKALRDIQAAGKSWDEHLMEKIPKLKDIIGRHAGRQFTPADPLVIVGVFNPEIIKAHRRVSVTIDQKFNNAGYLVQVYGDTSSTIKVVEEIDAHIFKTEMEKSIQKIIDAAE